ncbi:DNA/RNA helicase domain-containing protein [Pedococcus sp. NPDC057267]|uniref:DNA/RNA helicase domain-containing protein n=1 Tax=Pedococcus sp. NPDC057267 TaxID=3346077 RepID=UPI00363CAA4A
MTLYRQSVAGFSALENQLAALLAEQMTYRTGRKPSAGEYRSWERSLPALHADLVAAGLHEVEMLFEYQLPLTSKRADVVLVGQHPQTGGPSYLVVELKQWSHAERFEDSDSLIQIEQYGHRPVTHPALQVRDYCDYMLGFTTVLADQPESLAGVAYLHNATESAVEDLYRIPGDRLGSIYTGQRRGEFQDFLRSRFSPGVSGAAYADHLLSSRIAPSRQLLAVAAEEVQHREMFVLLDEQRDAYNYVLHAVERARRANTKTAVIVSGGPGSGKSVIALSLLGELSRQGRSVLHATGSRSFTQTLRKVAGKRAPRVQKMFQYFNSFIAAEPNDLDALILDEAHRIRDTSASRWTRAEHRTGKPQVEELLDAARVPVFLLDEFQVVRPGEQGTVEDIEKHAANHGIEVVKIDLDAQFRCGGSEEYVLWAKRLLGLEPGGPMEWTGDPHFDVEVVDSPYEMEAYLATKLEGGYSARMAAGYCWPWSDPRPDGTLVPDVQVGDWAKPWNLKGERSVGGAPAAALWATDPAGFGQVGCVYTAQGFEYDYSGVILGPDLVWREDRWIPVRAANCDPDFKNRTKVSDVDFDRLVRNVYKVLLTRGMRGVTLFSTDPETQEFLRGLVR